jgi:predicted TIM-barrel fold metal-dependent hydrolase
VDKVNGTFPQLIDALRAILQPFTTEEQRKFFAGNAKKFYRL